jgi:hypothetical protein
VSSWLPAVQELAIALLGIFVFVVFSASLDARVTTLDLPPEAQQLEAVKVYFGAAQVPEGLGGATAAAVQSAIVEAFVASFRIAMFVAAGLAVANALATAILIASWKAPKGTVRDIARARAEPNI